MVTLAAWFSSPPQQNDPRVYINYRGGEQQATPRPCLAKQPRAKSDNDNNFPRLKRANIRSRF
ncbi:hypothetical protein E2C01_065926 [Portunus trituberculatus]|uniref:Uncharacterized protein n=1 Tax=Portunus trituberculatus TaxID=210409 RepID=A0A5B7HK59_PORTR|nr:hypothetical protein [Portunus trituberculatus]